MRKSALMSLKDSMQTQPDVWTCGGLCAVFALTSGETFRKVKSSAAGAENHLPLRDFFAAAPSEAVAVAKNLGGCTLELPYPVASL